MMCIVIANQRVEWCLQFARHIFEELPFVFAGVLHVIAGELDKVRPDQFIDFIHHPKSGLVIWAVGGLEM